jgi:hypothetical protein
MTGIIELDAFLFGIICTVPLPLGAILALKWTPKPKVLASMMAIGAGALLAALTIDLVAVSVEKGLSIVKVVFFVKQPQYLLILLQNRPTVRKNSSVN